MTARDTVLAAIRENYGTEDVAAALDDHGDSFSRVCLIVDMEEELGVDIPDVVAFAWVTVGDVVAWTERAVSGRAA